MARPLSEIAQEAAADWDGSKSGVYFGAKPYLRAMRNLETIDDYFGEDSARDVILYFLSNARTWRGPTAQRIKAELKEMIK